MQKLWILRLFRLIIVVEHFWQGEENSKKGWARGREKSKSRTTSHGSRGLLALSPQMSGSVHLEASPTKQSPKGPRMPDGTRGFTMGRGKPILSGIP